MGVEITEVNNGLGRFERLATAASVFCAVECAAKPFAIILLPLFGVKLVDSELLELAIIGLVFVLGLGSIAHRFFTRHRSYRPMIVFFAGFAALASAHFVLEEETMAGLAVAIAGAALIAVSQFMNRRVGKDCCEFHAAN
ncbi:MAG TPA: MerC domain-containing protein [Pyrinomonadaceae bacterium]|nr:MerC domain-containing protein [Pyrinomonadaceae bacterium]HMP66417.1 MerC domain-containing protein [Pyrinomonadaceae bacterium]